MGFLNGISSISATLRYKWTGHITSHKNSDKNTYCNDKYVHEHAVLKKWLSVSNVTTFRDKFLT
uniref:Uncharacterized protein n=1 Tax=Romanomermis culicivorax TaxID=13658 RepID=A0A915HH31_ROMCU